MPTDSPMSRTCSASRSASECTVATATPRCRQVRAMRHAISPRLAMSNLRITILPPHSENAELRRREWPARSQVESQSHHSACFQRIDHIVDPQMAGEVVDAGESFELLADGSLEGQLLALRPTLTVT